MLHRFAMAIVYHVTTLKRKPQFSLFYFSPLTFPFFPALRFIYPSPTVYSSPPPLRISPRSASRIPSAPFCVSPSCCSASPFPPRPSPFLLPMPCACPPCRRARREGFALARSGASAAGLAAPWAEERVRAAKRRAFCPPAGRLKYERVRAAKRRRIGGTGMQLPGRWRNGPAAGGGAEGAERAPDENAPPGVAGGAGERQGGVSLRRAPRARPDRRAAPPRRSRSAGAARRHIRPARCRPPCRSRRPR